MVLKDQFETTATIQYELSFDDDVNFDTVYFTHTHTHIHARANFTQNKLKKHKQYEAGRHRDRDWLSDEKQWKSFPLVCLENASLFQSVFQVCLRHTNSHTRTHVHNWTFKNEKNMASTEYSGFIMAMWIPCRMELNSCFCWLPLQ